MRWNLGVRALVLTLTVLLTWSARAADEPDELMPGTSFLVRTGTLAKFLARPPAGGAFDLPDTPANDPRTEGGMLHIFDTRALDDNSYNLPAGSGWKGLGNPAGSAGFKYTAAQTLSDPCTVVIVEPHAVKAVCKGPGVALTPPFVGRAGVVLTVGTGSKRYCASFGGRDVRNRSEGVIRRAAPPPDACLTPPKFCAPLTKWGAFGSGDGQFRSPGGVATDVSGNVYVADVGNHRIQKFDGSGTFVAKWGTMGSGDGQFSYPEAVATDASGNVYVADTNNNRIQKFDGSGTFLTKWGAFGSGDGQFRGPGGVATDASGNVYVADPNNNRIQKFFGCP
ncbi:MAG TPA: hypothetical protein VLI07_02370 [Candidatus Binatus sp.]|nr:hypothetical protein [Candidatus Binatus sp.]